MQKVDSTYGYRRYDVFSYEDVYQAIRARTGQDVTIRARGQHAGFCFDFENLTPEEVLEILEDGFRPNEDRRISIEGDIDFHINRKGARQETKFEIYKFCTGKLGTKVIYRPTGEYIRIEYAFPRSSFCPFKFKKASKRG